MPFAGFDSMEDCKQAHSDKDDPGGFCAYLHKEATGEYPNQSGAFDDADEHLRACVAGAIAGALDQMRGER